MNHTSKTAEMDSNDIPPHFLLATMPYQSHLNPTLHLARRLIHAGARVTVATTIHGHSRIKTFLSLQGLAYASFSDGFDEGTSPSDHNQDDVMYKCKYVGSQTLTNLLQNLSREGRPVTFLIYGMSLSWAADVARAMSIPSAFLFIQAAALFAIYHHCLNALTGVYYHTEITNFPPRVIKFEGLPPFEWKDIPSYLLPNSPYFYVTTGFREHFQILADDPNPCVLINTFDALEEHAIKALSDCSNIKLITIGPLVPSDKFLGCDLFENSCHDYYISWLNSKPDCSVVYISFGSLAVLPRNQIEEIFDAIVETGYPFLWVIRASSKDGEEDDQQGIKNKMKEEEEQGLIVPWCSQVEVLNHRAIGCFLTHCGWNSTTECLVAGVPMISFPRFADQSTNAKLVEEVWESGVRVKVNEDGVAEKEEIKRCLETVMGEGEKGKEMRRNAKKWRGLALEATGEGGSSANSFKFFMEKHCRRKISQ